MSAVQSEFFPAANLGHADRTLRFTFGGIRYQVADAPLSWRAPLDDCLLCLHCDDYLDVIAPNLLHSVPLARCACSSSFLTPLDDRDRGLLELAYPVSEQDKNLAERFYRELHRLTKEGRQ